MKTTFRIGILSILVVVLLFTGCSKKGLQPLSDESRVPEYIIGPEDVLKIEVWRENSLSLSIPVRLDGKISLPLVHDVQAAGLTPLQLEEALRERLKEYIDVPHVSVIVMEANSFKVYVSGQVKSPGLFKLRTHTSLLQIIPMAGGFTDWANQKKILIIRKEEGKENRIRANYKKMVDGKEPALFLKPGDTIIVP
jgi:polysaccharide biosynthesis/export protein